MIEQQNEMAYAHKLEMAQSMAELSVKEKEIVSTQSFGKAYIVSLLFPPMGIYYFVKYLFFAGGDRDHVKAGVLSLVLTLASLFISLWSLAALLNQTTSSLPLQDIQSLKDLTTPENQKKIIDLYK